MYDKCTQRGSFSQMIETYLCVYVGGDQSVIASTDIAAGRSLLQLDKCTSLVFKTPRRLSSCMKADRFRRNFTSITQTCKISSYKSSLSLYFFNVCHLEMFNTYINIQ